MDTKEENFKKLLSEFRDRIYRLCCSFVFYEDDRKELFQEILIKIWRNIDRFKGESSVSTWIYRVSLNTCIDFRRKTSRQEMLLTAINENNEGIIDKTENLEKKYIMSEKIEMLYKYINRLSFLDKSLVSLYLEDLSYKDISEILGISEKNVSVKLHRIKKILNSHLKD